MKHKIIILDNPEYEMAGIFYKDKYIIVGNYWDFHPGCHGREFEVDGRTIWVENFSSAFDFAEKLAGRLNITIKIKKTKENFWD